MPPPPSAGHKHGLAVPAPAAPPVANLGDIMGQSELGPSALGQFSQLERIVLQANGNLQRLVSSYYNSPVTVTQRYNTRTGHGMYDRQVELCVFYQVFGVATSTIEVTQEDLIDAIENGGVAIGQLFRHFNILPEFSLHSCGHGEDGHLWRRYVLRGCGIVCDIKEEFISDMFQLRPRAASGARGEPSPVPHGLGDIMSSNVTGLSLPDGFTPLQRLLLTANGNIARLMSAFYGTPVTTCVMLYHRRCDGVYDRQIAMNVYGQQFMSAKSTISFTAPEWQRKAEIEGVPIGSLFRAFDEMPTFTLRGAGLSPAAFWRDYTLAASGMTCEITETFAEDVFDRTPYADEALPDVGYTLALQVGYSVAV